MMPLLLLVVAGAGLVAARRYLCMIAQSLMIKSNIETRRSVNQLGIIVWQFNEIWCARRASTSEINRVRMHLASFIGG